MSISARLILTGLSRQSATTTKSIRTCIITSLSEKSSTKTGDRRLSTASCNYKQLRLISELNDGKRRTSDKQSRRELGTQVLRPYIDPEVSYAFGRSNEHLIYSTVGRELEKRLRETPDELAFISYYENKHITFRQLERDINKLAKALVKQFNVVKGDHVGVFAYNCYNWLLIKLACSKIGAVLSPINPSYKAQELAFVLKKGCVKVLFMPGPKSVHSELNDHMSVLQSEIILAMSQNGELELRNVILMDPENEYNDIECKLSNCQIFNWSSIAKNDGLVFKSLEEAEEAGFNKTDKEICVINPENVSPDDTFAVYYTSGTTGTPKGACISHFTVINNVRFCQIRLRNGRPSNWRTTAVTILPMFHIFAGVLNTLSPLVANCTIVYSSYKYDIKSYVEAIIKYQANLITLTPTILIDMLAYIETNKLASQIPLQIIQPGGAPLSPEVVARTFKILPKLEELRCGYGSTENGSVSTFQTIHEPFETRPFTVGPPLDFTEVRIVKPNTNETVKLGERGEIQTRGYNTMTEYLGEPTKTAEVLTQDRWYKTGDLGFLHPHGSVQICGRLKHMIIKGGENIYPEEVEQLIHELEFVEDVHVIGVPDRRFGEQVCAWIKFKESFKKANENEETLKKRKEEILRYCKENITYFKVPKYLLFVDSFPMTPTKKVQNHIMIEQSIKLLNLESELDK